MARALLLQIDKSPAAGADPIFHSAAEANYWPPLLLMRMGSE